MPPTTPMPSNVRKISSDAYAVEESASELNTASAVVLVNRSCSSWSVLSALPRTLFLNLNERLSGISMDDVAGNGAGPVER